MMPIFTLEIFIQSATKNPAEHHYKSSTAVGMEWEFQVPFYFHYDHLFGANGN